ncbi:MAG: ribosome-associated translation inhibitor RaiA, partial [Leptotrichiaceae bacterium]
MKVIISGRHLKITEPIKEYTEEKIGRLKKYFDNILEVDVTLSVEHSKTEGD